MSSKENEEVLADLVSSRDLERVVGVSVQTIKRWRIEEGMPYVRIPAERDTIRFRFKKVVSWCKEKGKELNGAELRKLRNVILDRTKKKKSPRTK